MATFDEWLERLRADAHERGDHEAQQYCQAVHRWRLRAEYAERHLMELNRSLEPLCPCDVNPETTDGPDQDCPLHGDGVSFVTQVRCERAELAARRASVTTGGPGAAYNEYGWQNGPSSRPPTAPPEPEEVELPVSDEQVGELQYGTCEDCGHPHPAWIGCEAEKGLRS
jgi:hypothetical protein